MDQVGAAAGMGQDLRQKDPLVDLEALLVPLGESPLRLHLRRGRHRPGTVLGRRRHELVQPERPLEAGGQLVVDRLDLRAQLRLQLEPLVGHPPGRVRHWLRFLPHLPRR